MHWPFFGPVKTGPSLADAAVGRIAQGTKILAEGGYEKIFQQNFETVPEEKLQKTYACYLSTSAGPVMGTLYLSTAKLAFCSDNPLSYQTGDQIEWSYYKVYYGFLCLLLSFWNSCYHSLAILGAIYSLMINNVDIIISALQVIYSLCILYSMS